MDNPVATKLLAIVFVPRSIGCIRGVIGIEQQTMRVGFGVRLVVANMVIDLRIALTGADDDVDVVPSA
ncbi:hypothetical protein JCM19235_1372 [Vibrio maritimus]|uniref:Uncharacterized protein n=1 Tax=Vibrio maritimus TaxID=990268 RepID=A0A090S6A2_9VIBR|nr:hypothetical protein JCM19235_1372 [Vibrio maritimus]